jgi:hypothetical protein
MQELLLKNNHPMMNTEVETFIIEETESLIYDNAQLEKWHSLIEKLNLRGQKQVAKQGLSPIPFLYMNQFTKKVCQTLCPTHVRIDEYDITPIPLPVLDLVALSIKENYFQQIEIWYDEQTPDPFCVGVTGYWISENIEPDFLSDDDYEESKRFQSKEELNAYHESVGESNRWSHFEADRYYLIAKWGDVKQSFEELTERAKARHKEQLITNIQRDISSAQLRLANVDKDCAAYFTIDDSDLPF